MWYPGKNAIELVRGIGHNVKERQRDREALREGASAPAGIDEAQAAEARARALYDQARAPQNDAQSLLAAAAAGNVPSRAEVMARQGAQQSVVDQVGMAAAQRGGSLAGQQRQVGAMGAAGAMQANQNALAIRAEEMANARSALAANANAMAGMDLEQLLQAQRMRQDAMMGNRGMDIQQLGANRQFGLNVGQGVANAVGQVGGVAMMSDRKLKDVEDEDAGEEALAAVRAIKPNRHRYKDPADGQRGPILGFMAQDLAKTPAGKQLVIETPRGKAVALSNPGVSALALAATAALARKVDELTAGARRG